MYRRCNKIVSNTMAISYKKSRRALTQLVHGPTQVVVGFLTLSPQFKIDVEKCNALKDTDNEQTSDKSSHTLLSKSNFRSNILRRCSLKAGSDN